MAFRPSLEMITACLLGVFLASGFALLTDPEHHLPARFRIERRFGDLILLNGPTGVRALRDGQGEDASFFRPRAMARDRAGDLFVLDSGNRALRRITPDAEVTTIAHIDDLADSGFFPDGIAVDTLGNSYVSDAENHRILKIDLRGQVSVLAGAKGEAGWQDGKGSAARFRQPSGLLMQADGDLVVADAGNHCLRQITPEGEVTTLGSTTPGHGDGKLAEARFFNPWGLTAAGDGTLFVADTHRVSDDVNAPAASAIRRISPQGVVTTLAENTTYGVPAGVAKNNILLDIPSAIALDQQGYLYYLLRGEIERLQIGRSGSDESVLPEHGTVHPTPQQLTGIVIGKQGEVFVDDAVNDYVLRLSGGKDYSVFAGTSNFIGSSVTPNIPGLAKPLVVRTDGSGNIYVLYDGDRHIRRLGTDLQLSDAVNRLVDDGSVPLKAPPVKPNTPLAPGVQRLFRAADLEKALGFHFSSIEHTVDGSFIITPASETFAVDNSQSLFIPSTCGKKNEPCVVRITVTGKASVLASGFHFIRDLQTDSQGRIYVYDQRGDVDSPDTPDQLSVLDPGGKLLRQITLEPAVGQVNGKVNHESGLQVDGAGVIYVADGTRIRRIDAKGNVSLLAGDARESGLADGIGSAARFQGITGIAPSPAGLYVGEAGSNSLREVSTDGKVTTLISPLGEKVLAIDEKAVGRLDQINGVATLPDGNIVLLNRYTILRTED